MIRELVENAIGLVRDSERKGVEEEAKRRVEERLLDLLVPAPSSSSSDDETDDDAAARHERTREKIRIMLGAGELEQRKVEITIEQRPVPMMVTGMGMEPVDFDLQGM